jgi:hypothetical protein
VKLYVEPGVASLTGGDATRVWSVQADTGEEVISFVERPTALAVREYLEHCEVESVAEAREMADKWVPE